MFWTGFLPTDRAQIYEVAGDDLYLVGHLRGEPRRPPRGPDPARGRSTAALRRLLDLLPARGGRRRQGHARHLPRPPVRQGGDVLVRRARRPPRTSTSGILAIEEEILQELEIPYRVVNVAAGDLGASAAKKYDCEAWLPGQQRYRELTSTSNTTDYQARRLRARFRPPGGGSPQPGPHPQRHGRRGGPHAAGDHGEPPASRRRIPRTRRAARIRCARAGIRAPPRRSNATWN